MRESFFEKVYLDSLFKTTSTQNQDSANEFRESAHILHQRNLCWPPQSSAVLGDANRRVFVEARN